MPVQEFKDAHPYARTVPQIFFNDNGTDINIGGFTELKNHLGE
jgi:glutaredoxin